MSTGLVAPTRMRAEVADSWHRSAAAGVEADRVEAPITLPDHRGLPLETPYGVRFMIRSRLLTDEEYAASGEEYAASGEEYAASGEDQRVVADQVEFLVRHLKP